MVVGDPLSAVVFKVTMSRHSYILMSMMAGFAISACVGDSPVSNTKCSPGQALACACPNGQSSFQSCSKDQDGYDPCLCEGSDSGSVGTDGGSQDVSTNPVSDSSSESDACVPLTKNQVCTNPADGGLPYCGNHSDNCGGNINCGTPAQCGTTCVSGDSCLTTQVCGHTGSCNLQGYELCNTQSDQCGGSISCGTCNYGSCLYGEVCACGKASGFDSDCSGGNSAYQCHFGGSMNSPCTLVDSTNHVYCCP